jgi:hypothetical protein
VGRRKGGRSGLLILGGKGIQADGLGRCIQSATFREPPGRKHQSKVSQGHSSPAGTQAPALRYSRAGSEITNSARFSYPPSAKFAETATKVGRSWRARARLFWGFRFGVSAFGARRSPWRPEAQGGGFWARRWLVGIRRSTFGSPFTVASL